MSAAQVNDSAILKTNYWYGMTAIVFSFAGIAILTGTPTLFLCAAIAIVYAGYARSDGDPPPVDDLSIERVLDEPVRSTDEVDVTVTVRNDGNAFIPHLRFVDGVPAGLEVIDGTPRCGAALHPGGSIEFEYTVAAARGEHVWEPATVILGNRSGSKERVATLERDSSIHCPLPPLETNEVPVRQLTSRYAGRVRTTSGGDGIEFYATRSYRRGDPLRHIDWSRLARTGELSTIQYHNERGVSVVLLIDARKAAYLAPSPGANHAVDRCVEAAGRIFSALLTNGDRVGIAVFGREEVWLSPRAGDKHRARGQHLFTQHPALAHVPPERERYGSLLAERQEELLRERVKLLHQRLPSDAQVFCLSPCCDTHMATS